MLLLQTQRIIITADIMFSRLITIIKLTSMFSHPVMIVIDEGFSRFVYIVV